MLFVNRKGSEFFKILAAVFRLLIVVLISGGTSGPHQIFFDTDYIYLSRFQDETFLRMGISFYVLSIYLLTGNRAGTWWNTLCWPEIDPGRGGTHSDDQKLTRDVKKHTLKTRNRPRRGREWLKESDIFYARDLKRGAQALRDFS